jgi:SAM-dependent methyltransferase
MNDKLQFESQVKQSYKTIGKAEFFYEIVKSEILSRGDKKPVTLDIGCGGGFHHRDDLQASLGGMSSKFIGVEPDPEAKIIDKFSSVHHCSLEDAPITPGSIDVAYSVMVMEHVTHPTAFFERLHTLLADGGVYLAFTVDARHWFSKVSTAMESTGVKDFYLNKLKGKRGSERYENFPTAYLCNTPRQLEKLGGDKFSINTVSLHKLGQMEYYLPKILHSASRGLDRLTMSLNAPGSGLLIVARKR